MIVILPTFQKHWYSVFVLLLKLSIFLSYETVAAMLQPTASGAIDDSSCSGESENSVAVKPKESPCKPAEEPVVKKTLPASSSQPYFPTSAEPYMRRSESSLSSKYAESWFTEEGEYSLMKKWPPLTEADLHEISTVPDTLNQDRRTSLKRHCFDHSKTCKDEHFSTPLKDELGGALSTSVLKEKG